uniref:Cytochrome p450 n=1 Tax=Cucumis melo subsp. melo TaxID=412675 RepID=E5GCU7_CUCME|nr:cytochrome p450 [Cucumis melo subsp. melo]
MLVEIFEVHKKLKRNGFRGPTPCFPLGNISEMKMKMKMKNVNNPNSTFEDSFSHDDQLITHNIHSTVFPYFARWQTTYGKVFTYWLGTEPFLYIADPEFVKILSKEVKAKNWGKPSVFKNDRKSMFGNGLVMAEGDEWVRQRHIITPAFNPSNLKAMASLMVESATKMVERWANLVISGNPQIEVEQEITSTAGEIIAKTSFGIHHESGRQVFNKLRQLQITLFKTNRLVGVPFVGLLNAAKAREAKLLGEEIDELFRSVITERREDAVAERTTTEQQNDLLSLLLKESSGGGGGEEGRRLSTAELIDECKTFFFGGHETTALALTWTLMLLAVHSEWQTILREEIKEVFGHNLQTHFDFTNLSSLKKMGWVMSEVLRLYPSAPNVQRQARKDIIINGLTIPNGTNMWIDVVSMHHDQALWGHQVNEFHPERFRNDTVSGGCTHKMGYLPFGFGGRMCVGRHLTFMEYKIVLTLILSRFSFSLSPDYRHSPSIMLSLRPAHGLPLVFRLLED